MHFATFGNGWWGGRSTLGSQLRAGSELSDNGCVALQSTRLRPSCSRKMMEHFSGKTTRTFCMEHSRYEVTNYAISYCISKIVIICIIHDL